MNDPIKIIHKFKNNYKRIQYKVYIFLGELIDEDIQKILESIKNKDFFNSLMYLSNKNLKILEEFYGNRWYEFFFISYHIKSQIKIIESNASKKKEIEAKFGKEWYGIHINIERLQRISYSFNSFYQDNLLDKKKKDNQKVNIDIDFKTHDNQLGGNDEDDDENIIEEIPEDEENEMNEEDLDEIIEDNFDLDEISKLYTNENEENIKIINQTSKLISEAINDKKWEKKIEDIQLTYDSSLDNITYDSRLEDIFNKYYIYDEYIFKDDTIKTMRNKICVSIPLSTNFNNKLKLIPETQYFWSSYNSNTGKENIMIGQKWIRKNELLKVDIKPNENLDVYEKLRNNLQYLKESFGSKIKREDDETNIIRFYNDFITINEIFMIDIYNELGINYRPSEQDKKNLFDVYINIYFPLITFERFNEIVNVLNDTHKSEKLVSYINNNFVVIKNDLKLEKEIYSVIENSKLEITKTNNKFINNFNENYIIQCNIHININDPKNITGTVSDTKYNLYRIFDNFSVNEEYPFMQYQTFDNQITYKLYTKTEKLDNEEVITKWFENTSYGISFKILTTHKRYIAINLNENGRIEYKITWKEEDKATVTDIITTYEYIRNLLKKINSENKKIKFMMPADDKFKYAFINSIQKFTLPENFKINHNDLSDFSRMFFPYIALVIEPKKRLSKKIEVEEKISKYGTYLRYKRISKYDNITKMHLRILYFLRNYEINDRELIDEISKQFNITQEYAVKEIDFVREKYGKAIRKSSKGLKKLKSLPKSKPPGIGIDIQGRERDKYKIRITGARNKEQLDEIIIFIKTLIYLYCETYLYKKIKYQKLKDILKTLNKIAFRRNKVAEFVDYETNPNSVKIITAIDKKRLGFKPEKGQNQWTRSCQNSGNDKKRRPELTAEDNIDKLVKSGYKLNEKSGYYEKEVEIIIRKKKYLRTIRAVKLAGDNGKYNFYTCDPSENQDHFYIGFLSRGNNPNDLCMPCCFKKDQLVANNKDKKNYYLKCTGEQNNNLKENNSQLALGDKVYILQETNKVQDGRFIYLPKYLDIFFNQVFNHDHKIKNHYLYESKSGYYFKYTIKHDFHNLLAALSNIYELSIEIIINKMIQFLENDKDDIFFTYLNNGDIKEIFKTKDNYINYLKTSNYLEYDIIGELISLPGLLSDTGIYFFILEKNNLIIKKNLDKDLIIERYYLTCLNYENKYNIDENRQFIVMIKDGKYYHPIFKIQKDEKKDKKIHLHKIFDNNNKQVEELKKYNNISCNKNLINKIIGNYMLFNKNIIVLLNDKFKIKKQYIDNRNKAKYLLLENGLYLPVFPSGISYKYKFDSIYNINKILSLKETIIELHKVNKILNIDYIPKSLFYDKKVNDNIRIISLFLENELIIPIKSEILSEKEIKKLGITIRYQALIETIDTAIEEYNNNQIKIIDERFSRVKQHLFKNESYNIYRLELSLYLQNNREIKDSIIEIVRNNKININDKKYELRKILFNIIDNKLAKKIGNIKKVNSMATIDNNLQDLENYNVNNLRDYCKINKTKETCNSKHHCKWDDNICKLRLTENLAIDFVNKVLEEMIQDNIQFKELIEENNYYVSDIVDYTQYSYRPNQKIIKTSNFNLGKIMKELFSQDNAPIIGHKKINKNIEDEIIEEYPQIVELGKQLYQKIISNKDSIIRAFVNCYYWINNSLYDIESRNLGYYSEMQTILTNRFKAKIIDYIQNTKNDNKEKYKKYLESYFNNNTSFFDSSLNKFRKQSYNTDCKLELLILSLITEYRIVVYNNYNNVIYLYLQGQIKLTEDNIKNFTKEQYRNNTIFIKLDFDGSNKIPRNIYSIYYN